MDDKFLHDLRRDPSPEFARRLRASLREREAEGRAGTARTAGLRELPAFRWAAAAASIAVIGVAFSFPAVRASAEAFLDLFRVDRIVGVAFDEERLRDLSRSRLDLPLVFGDEVEHLTEPGAPVSYAVPEEAAAAAGIEMREPAWLPAGYARFSIEVMPEQAMRVRASTIQLQQVLDGLGIDDLTIPARLDGSEATVRVPPIVRTVYRSGDNRIELLQARSPEVSFPRELDLPVLAEIGLRILGLDREAAYRLAWSIDWRSTLLVPVPVNAAAYRQIDVAGEQGLLIEGRGNERSPGGQGGLVLWSASDRVFALAGPVAVAELLEMAQTLQ